MDTTESMSDGQRSRAFYLQGTAVLSNVPGRIERFVTARLTDRRPVTPTVQNEPVREFYLPGTAALSAIPGRVERLVSKRLGDHSPRDRVATVAEHVREFYLPATLRR